MAMIKCKECEKEMSDHAKICPHCGYENSIMFCPECDKQLSSKANMCPHCGYAFKNKRHNIYSLDAMPLKILIMVVIVLKAKIIIWL